MGQRLAEVLEKSDGLCTVLSFLGIEIDSVRMVFHRPAAMLVILKDFCSVHKVTPCQSLLGLLVFVCRVMPTGQVFSRRLLLAIRGGGRPEHRIRLTKSLKADLSVWRDFLHSYNGRLSGRGGFQL